MLKNFIVAIMLLVIGAGAFFLGIYKINATATGEVVTISGAINYAENLVSPIIVEDLSEEYEELQANFELLQANFVSVFEENEKLESIKNKYAEIVEAGDVFRLKVIEYNNIERTISGQIYQLSWYDLTLEKSLLNDTIAQYEFELGLITQTQLNSKLSHELQIREDINLYIQDIETIKADLELQRQELLNESMLAMQNYQNLLIELENLLEEV